MKKRNLLLAIAVLMIIAVPVFSANELTATLGNQMTDNDYQVECFNDIGCSFNDIVTFTESIDLGTETITQDVELIAITEDTLVAADSGKILVYTNAAAGTIVLPAAADGLVYHIIAGVASTITLDPASTDDTIVASSLVLDGGDKLTTSGVTSDTVILYGDTTNSTWYTTISGGTVTDGGA